MRAASQRTKLLKLLGYGAAAALLGLAPTVASAGKFKVLHTFCSKAGCDDGANPIAPLVRDLAGNFFGTTENDGKNGHGTAFELVNAGGGKYKFKTIYSFFGTVPGNGGLIVDTAGNLYGTDSQGFYQLAPPSGDRRRWLLTELVTIPDVGGSLTYAGAASGAPWNGSSPLYGVTSSNADSGGSVYQLMPGDGSWHYSELYQFCSQQSCADGSDPNGVLLDQSGVLYGTTFYGCPSGCNADHGAGVAFELAPAGGSWTETVLHTFCSAAGCADGANPTANLVQDAAGNLIGVTADGGGAGKHQGGTLFKIVPNGAQSEETVLYAFCQRKDCKDGAYPLGTPLLDQAGNIFGTTERGGDNEYGLAGAGIAYELSGSTFRVLHSFCSEPNCADGSLPSSGLVGDANGHLYGTASGGGGPYGTGTVYQLTP